MNKQKKPERAVLTVSHTSADGSMAELVLKDNATAFCTYGAGGLGIAPYLKHANGELRPIPPTNNLLKHAAVLLPSEASTYRDVSTLLEELRSYINRYVDISPDFVEVVCAYVLLTWVYEAFNELCYLRFSGDYGSGKSRALIVIGAVCNKPFFASAASTISPVFYTLDTFRGTLILDEADFRYSDLQADIVKIMNNGSTKGFPVLRQTQTETRDFDPRAFHVFGPKVVAMRKTFDDVALESRFLTEDMNSRSVRADIPFNLPDIQRDEALRLRNKLLMYRFQNLASTTICEDQVDRARSGRFNQTLVPLLSIAPTEDMRAAIRRYGELSEERTRSVRALSIEAELIGAIRELLASELTDAVSVGEIASALRQRVAGEFDRPITPRYVGQLLRRDLGLFTFKRHGAYVLPRSEEEKIERLAKRYGL
ncbi:winged helix-turn-helix domain-containing protein [Ramlibacter sp. RBP-2]|uniref:Winged helix-turn-helix domain-containing protein n=1 Tax=Ramlibacter lithotrophicus TaxID=2606681 RepID=A0A7X6I6X0_9BURK|nr:winged helix-turn-helix domain-containing protein [Ramlibacter lithotrophicus]NKE66866.1 winged helix-turn-helix domain-containing protein [Ramlibacter lithotrophicus]